MALKIERIDGKFKCIIKCDICSVEIEPDVPTDDMRFREIAQEQAIEAGWIMILTGSKRVTVCPKHSIIDIESIEEFINAV